MNIVNVHHNIIIMVITHDQCCKGWRGKWLIVHYLHNDHLTFRFKNNYS